MVLVINVFYRTVVSHDVKLGDKVVILAQIDLEGTISSTQIKREIKIHTSLFIVIPASGSVEILVVHIYETLISKFADSQHR
jgi:hypothetical protein